MSSIRHAVKMIVVTGWSTPVGVARDLARGPARWLWWNVGAAVGLDHYVLTTVYGRVREIAVGLPRVPGGWSSDSRRGCLTDGRLSRGAPGGFLANGVGCTGPFQPSIGQPMADRVVPAVRCPGLLPMAIPGRDVRSVTR